MCGFDQMRALVFQLYASTLTRPDSVLAVLAVLAFLRIKIPRELKSRFWISLFSFFKKSQTDLRKFTAVTLPRDSDSRKTCGSVRS